MKPLLGKSNRILFFEKYGNMGEHHALMRQFISRMIQSVPDTCLMYVHNTQSIIYYIFVYTVFVTHTHMHMNHGPHPTTSFHRIRCCHDYLFLCDSLCTRSQQGECTTSGGDYRCVHILFFAYAWLYAHRIIDILGDMVRVKNAPTMPNSQYRLHAA